MQTSQVNWSWITALLLLLQGFFFLSKTSEQPIGDFANYYYASQLWLEGHFDEQVYDPYAFNLLVNQRAPDPVFINYTPVPPVSVLFYSPFALIENIYVAKGCFNGIGLLLFLLAYLALIRTLGLEQQPLLLLTPLLFYSPILNNFFQGQAYLYLMAALMEGFRQWQKGRMFAAAVLWSLPIALKIFPGILVLFLFFQKDKRPLVFTLIISAGLSFSTYLYLPATVTTEYFSHILPRLFRGEIHNPFAVLFQSMQVLLKLCFERDELLNPHPFWDFSLLANVLHGIFQFLILGITILVLRDKDIPQFLRFSLVLLASFLLTGYGSSYGLFLLLPFFLATLFWGNRSLCVFLFLLLLICNVPIYRLYEFPLLLQFPRLYALILLFALVIWKVKPAFEAKVIGLVFLIIFGKSWMSYSDPTNKVDYYLPDDRYGILHDYHFSEGELSFHHFNQKGIQESQLRIRDTLESDEALSIVQHQIYYQGVQITHTRGQKRQPMRLDQREILYLSDEDRGVGFYTLRKVTIPDMELDD